MLKTNGIIRKIDRQGRISLPFEISRLLSISADDSLNIYDDGERIILKRYTPDCLFCGSAEENVYFKGKLICRACIYELV